MQSPGEAKLIIIKKKNVFISQIVVSAENYAIVGVTTWGKKKIFSNLLKKGNFFFLLVDEARRTIDIISHCFNAVT